MSENGNKTKQQPESTTKKIVIGVVIGVLVSIICTGQTPAILQNLGIIPTPTSTPAPTTTPVVIQVQQETSSTGTTSTETTSAGNASSTTTTPTLKTYTFSSTPIEFSETLNKSVYTGPCTYYVRAANGKAQFVSRAFKYGGRDGDWLFVRCTVNNGMRYG